MPLLFDFDRLNETDVREEILQPLIRRLGYQSSTSNNVIREQSLRYPKSFLGRKTKQDPILRGKADYILEAEGKVRWILEAKSPQVNIGRDEIEQAYTYAIHPEVRAVYFVISNGRVIQIFDSSKSPNLDYIYAVNYEELDEKYPILENILSPAAIIKDHPEKHIDTGNPLGKGLRSTARITHGIIKYHHSTPDTPILKELQISIQNGSVERDDEGKVIAFIHTISPFQSFQLLNERLRLSSLEMTSNEQILSTDEFAPTSFTYQNTIILAKGEELLDIKTW